jgi:large subunit ribosomal protein L25
LEPTELKVSIRENTGKGPARSLRREAAIPAVLYGPHTKPVLLSVDIRDFEQIVKKGNISQTLINLAVEKSKKAAKKVMVKELQRHPVTNDFLHIDFYEIDMKRKIKVRVPVVVHGKSVGVERGGLLQIIRRKLDVLCLPGNIPESIEIDIAELDIGDSVHVEEIETETDIEIPADVNFTVLTVISPKKEEEPEEEELEEEELEEGAEEAAEEGEPSEKEQETS